MPRLFFMCLRSCRKESRKQMKYVFGKRRRRAENSSCLCNCAITKRAPTRTECTNIIHEIFLTINFREGSFSRSPLNGGNQFRLRLSARFRILNGAYAPFIFYVIAVFLQNTFTCHAVPIKILKSEEIHFLRFYDSPITARPLQNAARRS